MPTPERFVFYLVEDFAHIAFSCAVEPLRLANRESGETLYEWSFASENGETAVCSAGTVLNVHNSFDSHGPADRVFVLAGSHMRHHMTKPLLGALRRERSHGAKIGALCSGAYILAYAGMLDGARAAIHWHYHDLFTEEFPEIELVPNVFVADEAIITASGGTATADLMLHLIGQTHGQALANRVADQMVYNTVREGSADQKLSVQAKLGIRNPRLTRAIHCMSENIEEPMATGEVADEVGISTRQLERLFRRHMQCSPSQYYLDLRLQKARNLLLQSERSVTEVAMATGFRSTTHFAKVYRKNFGVSPNAQRARLT
ncbi:MAG: GlxA family transcriptional regulator [Pseudomonadota bacterium]